MGYLRVWDRPDTRHAAARKRLRLRFLAALVALVGMLAIATHSDVLAPVSHAPHPTHTVASSVDGDLGTTVEHPHLANDSSTAHHEAFASVVLPKSVSSTLIALGLVLALVAVAAWLTPRVVLTGRDPPTGLAGALTGHDLLTRLCISRR